MGLWWWVHRMCVTNNHLKYLEINWDSNSHLGTCSLFQCFCFCFWFPWKLHGCVFVWLVSTRSGICDFSGAFMWRIIFCLNKIFNKSSQTGFLHQRLNAKCTTALSPVWTLSCRCLCKASVSHLPIILLASHCIVTAYVKALSVWKCIVSVQCWWAFKIHTRMQFTSSSKIMNNLLYKL